MTARSNYKVEGGPVDSIERQAVSAFVEAFRLGGDAMSTYHLGVGFFRAKGLSQAIAERLARFVADIHSESPIIW